MDIYWVGHVINTSGCYWDSHPQNSLYDQLDSFVQFQVTYVPLMYYTIVIDVLFIYRQRLL